MKQEIIKNDNNEKDITVNFGDMFEWTGTNTGKIFIYLGYNKCYRLPLSTFDTIKNRTEFNGWDYSKYRLIEFIKEGKLKKCEKGTKFIIEQD